MQQSAAAGSRSIVRTSLSRPPPPPDGSVPPRSPDTNRWSLPGLPANGISGHAGLPQPPHPSSLPHMLPRTGKGPAGYGRVGLRGEGGRVVTAHMFRAQRRRLRTSAPQFPEVRENASRLILAVSPCSRMHKCRDTAGTRAAAVAQPRGAVSSLLGGRGCFLRFHRDRRTARVPQWPAAPLQQQCRALPRSHTQRYGRGRRLLAVEMLREHSVQPRSLLPQKMDVNAK